MFNRSCTLYPIYISGKTLLKFWIFEFSSVYILNFWILKISHFWNYECFFNVSNRYYHLIFLPSLTFIILVLWKSFAKMSFFNDKKFHFQKSLTKPKPKIGSNGILIRVSWHSCVLKRNNVPWLPWFQMEKIK